MSDSQGSILLAMIWMAVISLLLFWLPLLGPLIGGIVGGKTAGSVSRGFLAAIIPAALLALLLFVLATGIGLPILGVMAGTAAFLVVVFQGAPLIVGALIGGLLA